MFFMVHCVDIKIADVEHDSNFDNMPFFVAQIPW